MKITLIEIECSAEELKQSRTLADNLTFAINRLFDRAVPPNEEPTEEEEENND